MKITTVRTLKDGTTVNYQLAEFDSDGPYHEEIRVGSIDELRELRDDVKLIGIKMRGQLPGKKMQSGIVRLKN